MKQGGIQNLVVFGQIMRDRGVSKTWWCLVKLCETGGYPKPSGVWSNCVRQEDTQNREAFGQIMRDRKVHKTCCVWSNYVRQGCPKPGGVWSNCVRQRGIENLVVFGQHV